MTGSPLLRAVLLIVALAAFALPLSRLTSRQAPAAEPVSVKAEPAKQQSITLRFDSPIRPSGITVEALGATVARLAPTTSPVEASLSLEFPPAGIDLIVRATWPEGSEENALRVRASTGSGEILDTTLWGSPAVEDVVTLPGTVQP